MLQYMQNILNTIEVQHVFMLCLAIGALPNSGCYTFENKFGYKTFWEKLYMLENGDYFAVFTSTSK